MERFFITALLFVVFGFSYGFQGISDREKSLIDRAEELKKYAEKGELSEEEYQEYVKLGLCKPLKDDFLKEEERRGWIFGEFCDKKVLTKNYQKRRNREEKKEDKEEKVVGMTGTGGVIVQFKYDPSKVKDPKYLDSLDAKKFRYLIQDLMDKATYSPTVENVERYLYVQDYMARKSLKFARVWEQVILSNEKLSPSGKFVSSEWEETEVRKIKSKYQKEFLNRIGNEVFENTGLYVFVSGGCKYCRIEAGVINNLIADYNFRNVKLVSKDYCLNNYPNCVVVPGLFEKFKVSVTPTIVLVTRGEDGQPKFQVIGRGLTSESKLVSRIIYYYKFLKNGKHIDDRTIIYGEEQ